MRAAASARPLTGAGAGTWREATLARKDDTEGKDYRRVTALERGLAVLHAFGPDNRPLGNAEIAARVGVPKPTVSRITFTLTDLGYLELDGASGRYRLGPGVLTLGYDVLAQMEIRDIARPLMQELADYADASVYLGVRAGLEIIYVEACRSPATMAIRLGVGSRIPIAPTGMGRAWLASLPEADRAALVARLAESHGDAWPAIEGPMRRAVAEAERQGFALTVGAWISEANSAGAVIRDRDLRPAYAVNVGGLRSIITQERLERDLGPRVLGLARQIEHRGRGVL